MFSVLKQTEYGRTGIISTCNGQIHTPAFIPVATKASIKGVLPEQMKQLGAQGLLANAYHLRSPAAPELTQGFL